MNLNKLRTPMSYKWKIQTVSNHKPQARCVAYIDARDVMNLLDLVCGPENWQDDYKMVGDRWMAGIGIKSDNEWVWKWDTGVAGNFEADKSEVSDSFKRAGVKWGIGRFLYDFDMEYVDTNKEGSGAYPVYPHNNERIWDLTKHINSLEKHKKRLVKYKKAFNALKEGNA